MVGGTALSRRNKKKVKCRTVKVRYKSVAFCVRPRMKKDLGKNLFL